MDVSRVSMVTPKVIDWRKLTAKEIIKYDSEGMNIPQQYLAWAQSFHVDLEKNDTDDTTYEMAISKAIITENNSNTVNGNQDNEVADDTDNQTTQTQESDNTQNTTTSSQNENQKTDQVNETTNQTGNVQKDENAEETEVTEENAENNEEDKKLTAEELKKKLEDDGKGLYSIAKIFKGESETKTEEADTSSTTVNAIGEASDNTISSLDSYMNELLAQAGDIQSQLNSLKNKNGKNENNMAKMLKLQQELKDLGTTGQNVTLGYESDLNIYTPTIDDGSTIGLDAQDYGNTTADMGRELKRYLWYIGFGRNLEKTGKNAVSAGSNAQEISSMVSEKNNANLDTIQRHQLSINDKTGVSAAEVERDNNNSQQNENANTDTNTKTSEKANSADTTTPKTGTATDKNTLTLSEKPLTPVQKMEKEEDNSSDDKKTDVEKKEEKIASGNLDEILKRKIRKGENV